MITVVWLFVAVAALEILAGVGIMTTAELAVHETEGYIAFGFGVLTATVALGVIALDGELRLLRKVVARSSPPVAYSFTERK